MRVFVNASIALLISLTAASVMAETVKRNMGACVTEELFDELTSYAVKNDQSGWNALMRSGGCTTLAKGEQVSVISGGFMVATIRYRGVKLYTASEAVR